MAVARCVDLTTFLGHETFRNLIYVRELDSQSDFVCPFRDKLVFSFFFGVLCVSMVAMPTGHKLVI